METLNCECCVCPAMTWWPVTGLFQQEYTQISGSKEKSAPHSDSCLRVSPSIHWTEMEKTHQDVCTDKGILQICRHRNLAAWIFLNYWLILLITRTNRVNYFWTYIKTKVVYNKACFRRRLYYLPYSSVPGFMNQWDNTVWDQHTWSLSRLEYKTLRFIKSAIVKREHDDSVVLQTDQRFRQSIFGTRYHQAPPVRAGEIRECTFCVG